jgi:transposase-like protein
MRADNSWHVIKAAQQRAEQTRRRAVAALRRMDSTGKPITFESVARQAGVSRSWLYAQQDLRIEVERLRARRRPQPSEAALPERQQASSPSLLRRLEAATERIRRLEQDNQELRDALAQALGDHRTSSILGATSRRDTPKNKRSKLIGPC